MSFRFSLKSFSGTAKISAGNVGRIARSLSPSKTAATPACRSFWGVAAVLRDDFAALNPMVCNINASAGIARSTFQTGSVETIGSLEGNARAISLATVISGQSNNQPALPSISEPLFCPNAR